MKSLSFDELCQGIFDATGRPAPELASDNGGASVVVLSVDDVDVRLLHCPTEAAGCVFVLVPFGVPEPEHELGALIALMEVNFGLMTDENGASYGRNPISGELLMQYTYPLAEAKVDELLIQILAMARISASWPEFLAEQAGALSHVAQRSASMVVADFA